ncbi:hypothetical protein ACROYT_G015738 [Oculina patagonica]
MFTAPLWCLLFGTAICLAVQDDFSDSEQKEMKKALGKAILKILGLKHPPKVPKELKENVPQSIRDAYNKQFEESEGKDLSVRTAANRDCSRRDFNVNFDDIYGDGNFVVAPDGYNAYHCEGRCPFPLSDHMNATSHAVIQTIQHTISSSSVPAACCVPTTLLPLNILYYDDQTPPVLQNRVMQDMQVEGCGCR